MEKRSTPASWLLVAQRVRDWSVYGGSIRGVLDGAFFFRCESEREIKGGEAMRWEIRGVDVRVYEGEQKRRRRGRRGKEVRGQAAKSDEADGKVGWRREGREEVR